MSTYTVLIFNSLFSNSFLGNTAKSLLTGITGNLAGTLIDLGVNFITTQLDEYIHRNEIAIQKAQELQESYNSFKLDNSNNISTLRDMQSEFDALSQGVDTYGDNISLSADEYARYQQIVGQVTALSPSLIAGYDAEGNALANKNQLLERAIELQQQEAKQKLEEYTSTENLQTLLKGNQASMQEGTKGAFGSMETNVDGEQLWSGGDFANFKMSLLEMYGIDEFSFDLSYNNQQGKELANFDVYRFE